MRCRDSSAGGTEYAREAASLQERFASILPPGEMDREDGETAELTGGWEELVASPNQTLNEHMARTRAAHAAAKQSLVADLMQQQQEVVSREEVQTAEETQTLLTEVIPIRKRAEGRAGLH
jgi:hypothetical protein